MQMRLHIPTNEDGVDESEKYQIDIIERAGITGASVKLFFFGLLFYRVKLFVVLMTPLVHF